MLKSNNLEKFTYNGNWKFSHGVHRYQAIFLLKIMIDVAFLLIWLRNNTPFLTFTGTEKALPCPPLSVKLVIDIKCV